MNCHFWPPKLNQILCLFAQKYISPQAQLPGVAPSFGVCDLSHSQWHKKSFTRHACSVQRLHLQRTRNWWDIRNVLRGCIRLDWKKNQWCIIIIFFFFKVFSLSVLLRFSSVLNLDHNPIVYLHKWNILPGHCMWDFSLKESFLVVSHRRLVYGKGQPLFFSSFFPKQIKDTGAYIFYNMSFGAIYLKNSRTTLVAPCHVLVSKALLGTPVEPLFPSATVLSRVACQPRILWVKAWLYLWRPIWKALNKLCLPVGFCFCPFCNKYTILTLYMMVTMPELVLSMLNICGANLCTCFFNF